MEHYATAVEIDSWTVDTSSWRTAAEPSSTGAKPLDVYAALWKTASPAARQIARRKRDAETESRALQRDI